MQENYEYVQRGFRILVGSLSGFIGLEMSGIYHDQWWNEVLHTLSDQYDLPTCGSYGDLVDVLDIANCIRLLDRRWNDVFRNRLPQNCRSWAKELMGVRNEVSHIGQQDISQPFAERALDTMTLLCREIDSDGANEIEDLYRKVRSQAEDDTTAQQVYYGARQPEAISDRGALTEGNLLKLDNEEIVERTTQTRKITFNGETKIYPVYKVRLDALFYNDQNDRIATWMSRYRAENGPHALEQLDREAYNAVIEEFICESNPEAIQKTQKQIAMVGQREPGVILADGRIVDGNRRYTCLRRIQRANQQPVYFETVIMEADIQADQKQIKLLELAIQHGEEKKVDYDLIDYAIGTYRDIVQTGLLTVEEYAASANESCAEVKKRIEIAGCVNEFLEHIHLPEQYHVAREYQVYSLLQEMQAPLHQLDTEGQKQLKTIAFNNAMMKAMKDQRKFIRDIKTLIKNNTYHDYFAEQMTLNDSMQEDFAATHVESKTDVDKFAADHAEITARMQTSMERALMRSRSQQLKAKPNENVTKCINLLLDLDARLFEKLNPDEQTELKASLSELTRIAEEFTQML